MALLAQRETGQKLVGYRPLYAISMFASFLFGYDQRNKVMSGIITGPHFTQFFKAPDAMKVGTMLAVLEIGAFITSIAPGKFGDTIGRKGTLCAGAVALDFTLQRACAWKQKGRQSNIDSLPADYSTPLSLSEQKMHTLSISQLFSQCRSGAIMPTAITMADAKKTLLAHKSTNCVTAIMFDHAFLIPSVANWGPGLSRK